MVPNDLMASKANPPQPPSDGLLPTVAYTDATMFRLEMQHVFGQAWICVAHEQELPRGGDFKTTYLGLQPVIVTRDPADRQLHVLINRCRHQGAVVCLQEQGNTRLFRCSYHGWSYNHRGDLIGIPGLEEEALLQSLRPGLTQVPRVGSYRGFVFASLSAEGVSLTEQLGAACAALDQFPEQSEPPLPSFQAPVRKAIYKANWKLFWDCLPGGAARGRVIFPNLLLGRRGFQVLRPIVAAQTEVVTYGLADLARGAVPRAATRAERDWPTSVAGGVEQTALACRQDELQRLAEAQHKTTHAPPGDRAASTERGLSALLRACPLPVDAVHGRWWGVMMSALESDALPQQERADHSDRRSSASSALV